VNASVPAATQIPTLSNAALVVLALLLALTGLLRRPRR
jgi:hypothetical protein